MAPLPFPARAAPAFAAPAAAIDAAWIFTAGPFKRALGAVSPALLACSLLAACRSDAPATRSSGAQEPEAKTAAYLVPITGDPALARGQSVWIENCRRCHATGLVGAPVIATEAWGPRAAKGLDTLFAHALSGFEGSTGTQMPARGGNPDLSDEDVKAAVRFMVSYYLPDSP
jgi:cytochrome c5